MQHSETKTEFKPRVLISHCLRATSIICGVRREMLTSGAQSSEIVIARRLGMAVAVALTGQSAASVGRGFGKDHSTVIEAMRWADHLAINDPALARTMRAITEKARQLAGGLPQAGGLPVADEVRRLTLARVPSLEATELTDAQRREARNLRAKGWSIGGLMRRYGIGEDEAYAAVGEKSPRQVAA